MKNIFFSFLISLLFFNGIAQNAVILDTAATSQAENLKFDYKQLIIPTLLVGYGIVGIGSDQLLDYNNGLKEEVREHIDKKITVDDFSQYAPALSVYALNNLGIKGKNNLKDRTIILGTSFVLVFSSITALKHITKVERPDGTPFSFPSGHTAMAFAGAEFLYQEYKDVSIWYGVSGYVVASATGAFRIYNNRHWLTDVLAGAGFGILSTKAAYWMFPYLNQKIFNSKTTKKTSLLAPFYNGKQMGCNFIMTF
jgi:membrane-associated phospholipid phosphatase